MSNSPRVLHILESLGRGGAETLVLDLLRHAERQGFPLFVAGLRGGDLEKEFAVSSHFFQLNRTLPLDPRAIIAVRKLIRALHIDIVHCHQPVDGLHGYLAAIGTETKVLLTFHGDPANQKWKDTAVARFLIPRVDRNVAVSAASREGICRSMKMEGRGRWSVVHNGIDPERLRKQSGNLRDELGLPSDAIIIGMVGNFQPWKDHWTLVQAFRQVVMNKPEVHLILVGGKSRRDPLLYERCASYVKAAHIDSHVHVLGPREDAVGLTAQFDWFVFATIGDTYALALVEALMLGVPCVVARTPAMMEISGGEQNVTFFEPSNVDSLTQQLHHVLNKRAESIEKSVRAKEWAYTHHTIENHVSRLFDLYSEICAKQ